MNWTAELNLPLDVDDLPRARPSPTGDTGRSAECEPPDVDDTEAANLADPRPLGVDQRDALDDRLARSVAQARSAPDASLERTLDVLSANFVAFGCAGDNSASTNASRKSIALSDNLPEWSASRRACR